MLDVFGYANLTWPDPCLDPSSPYHIHYNEKPSSISISPALDGSNYLSWSW